MEDVRSVVCSFDNLYKAMRKCVKGVKWKDSVSRYYNSGLLSTLKLKNSLDDDTYKIDNYCRFTIYEPKQREIVSTKLKDRVFQRSLCDNYLYEEITKRFIYDNGACQVNKGTSFARNRLKTHLHKYYRKHGNEGYVLKIDFKNYFGSTPHYIAKEALRKAISDQWALEKVFDIVDSYNDDGSAIGLGLGSQVTQLVQLLVLSNIDHYVKEQLRLKHYMRYMDDIIVISESKDSLIGCLEYINEASKILGLTLNVKKTQLFKLSQGINFLGFKFKLSDTGAVHMLINHKNISKRKRKLRKYQEMVLVGRMSKEKADESYRAWCAHANNGNSYNLVRKMDDFYNILWND